VLVRHRAKPAVPFGGIYRIIDFTLSNLMRSGIERVGILTQYLPYSLSEHIGRGEAWGFVGRSREARILPPHTGVHQADWYRGTADAVYRNLSYLRRHDPGLVLVVSGDHIYAMDYTPMMEFHLEQGAAATIAVQRIPLEACSQFGTVLLDGSHEVRGFEEKPASPRSPWISLGIYVFDPPTLVRRLEEVTGGEGGVDFARHLFPRMLERGDRIVAYPFDGYWQDVGTLDAYFQTHMQLVAEKDRLDIGSWGVRTNLEERRRGDRGPFLVGRKARLERVLLGRGARIEGSVRSSVLSPGVVVEEGAEVVESVLFHDVHVGRGARIHRAILDKNVRVESEAAVGAPLGTAPANVRHPDHLHTGLTVVGKGAVIGKGVQVGRNVLIGPGAVLDARRIPRLEDGGCLEEED
jgi:glucose-1-phosphate adenylyltransferase